MGISVGLALRFEVLVEATVAGPSCRLLTFPCVIFFLVAMIILPGVGSGLDLFGRDDGHNVSTLFPTALIVAGASKSGTILVVIKLSAIVFLQDAAECSLVEVSIIAESV